jgi:hypothetical protein
VNKELNKVGLLNELNSSTTLPVLCQRKIIDFSGLIRSGKQIYRSAYLERIKSFK